MSFSSTTTYISPRKRCRVSNSDNTNIASAVFQNNNNEENEHILQQLNPQLLYQKLPHQRMQTDIASMTISAQNMDTKTPSTIMLYWEYIATITSHCGQLLAFEKSTDIFCKDFKSPRCTKLDMLATSIIHSAKARVWCEFSPQIIVYVRNISPKKKTLLKRIHYPYFSTNKQKDITVSRLEIHLNTNNIHTSLMESS